MTSEAEATIVFWNIRMLARQFEARLKQTWPQRRTLKTSAVANRLPMLLRHCYDLCVCEIRVQYAAIAIAVHGTGVYMWLEKERYKR